MHDRNNFGSSSFVSGNLRKMLGNVHLAFGTILENLRKVVGNLGKIVRNVIILIVGLCNKQNNTWLPADMKFLFSCSTCYLTNDTREISSVVQEKINSLSTRARVLFCTFSGFLLINKREFKQIATAGATTAAVTEKVWGEYVAAVCQILAK